MDVSIKPTDKRLREEIIKARDDKMAARAGREERREARRDKKTTRIISRRLRRRIERKVLANLHAEKQNYLNGQPTGGEYVIGVRIGYRGKSWRLQRQYVEGVLLKVLATHTGFEYKINYDSDYAEDDNGWCNLIMIQYTLLDHSTTPS